MTAFVITSPKIREESAPTFTLQQILSRPGIYMVNKCLKFISLGNNCVLYIDPSSSLASPILQDAWKNHQFEEVYESITINFVHKHPAQPA
jgi:hypothetical protein